jgi:uncharacterized membrane protein
MNLHTLKPLPFCAALLMITPVVWAQTKTPPPSPTPTPGVKHYRFKIVNPNNNAETDVRSINNGQIYVGDTATDAQYSNQSENGYVAKGTWLQQFSVPKSYGAVDTDANGISNNNVIVGMYDIRSNPFQTTDGDHGYLLDAKGFHKLPDPDFTIYDRYPDWNGINADRDVVGIAFNMSTFHNDAFKIEGNGTYTYYNGSQVGPTYGTLEFNGINDKDAIVGEVQDATTGTSHGLLFKNGTFYVFDFPGGFDTIAFGINNDGDIVGAYTDPVTFIDHGFVLEGFPAHPEWFTVDNGNTAYPNTTIRTINDREVIGGKISTPATVAPHSEVGFVAEPK